MSKKFIVLVSLVLVLGPAGNALGVHIWDDGGPDHLWSTAQNWSTDTVPGSNDTAKVKNAGGYVAR